MPIPRLLLTTLLAASLLAGCGLKGSLYLPDKKPDESEKSARPATTDDEPDERQPADATAQP